MIGVFDSGYGGLTILRQIRKLLPQYDYLYLGDNARAPYGSRSFDVVYRYTLEAVTALFDRVLGVIRPTVEVVGSLTHSRHVGILATQGTIRSRSYELELHKSNPDIAVTGVACPMWVPLVENCEYDSPGADYFVQKRLDEVFRLDPDIDTLVLACTHYPLLMNKIVKYAPPSVRIIPQGDYVAASLQDYLRRHPEMDVRLSRRGNVRFLTTEDPEKFLENAAIFMPSTDIEVEKITL